MCLNAQRFRARLRRGAAAAALSMALSAPLAAGIDIPGVPLEAGAFVPSNLLFILDDSGSMQWEVMPDEIIHPCPESSCARRLYLFPLPDNGSVRVYEGTNYDNRVHDFDDTDARNVFRRSPHNNTTFYDPTLTYQPWLRGDGASFGNAPPTAAPYNPAYAAAGTMDLTVEQNQRAIWDSCGSGSCWRRFWPITFYMYKGAGDVQNPASYVKYQIRGSQGYRKELPHGSETVVTRFEWPGGISRSVAEETQNFANWFTYYRSRILAARGATSIAFAGLSPDNFRVGFRTINNNASMNIPIAGRLEGTFSGAHRNAWYDMLFTTPIHRQTTPLRTSLRNAGEYYKNTSNSGPWGPAPQLECRRSFTILTSDGYWNDSFTGVGNADGSAGSLITGPDGQRYTYAPERPYSDGYSNTLADVAMAYWKQDLRPDLANRVRPTPTNPAFWQHMSTFTIGLGVRGTLDPDKDLPDLISGAKRWPNPAAGDYEKLDDMWHAAINGRGIFVAAQNAQEFAAGLKKALDAIGRDGAVMNVAVTSASLTAGSKVFRARYDGSWGGDLAAYPVEVATNRPHASPSWSAADALDRLASHTSRNIWTRSGGVPKRFEWSSLNDAQKAALGNDPHILDYLRGDRSGEIANGGRFRTRTSRLGDIVNSSPVYVRDTHTVYVGANDGMLHAFDANDGREFFAYVPESAYQHLAELADPHYSHRFFVDGELTVSTKEQGGGKNILVGSLGRGGKGLFALDVSNPAGFGAAHVLWEFTDDELGQVIGAPVIVKLNNGDWAVMVGNGYNSRNHKAALLLIDLKTGARIKTLGTGAGTAANPNGLAQAVGWDVDRDGTVDTVYAGDLHGNLWRFDLSKPGVGSWKTDGKLFEAADGEGKPQPITGAPAIAINPKNGDRWVIFGTGRFLTYDDRNNKDVQSWYGVIDDGGGTVQRTALYARKVEYVTNAAGRRVRVFSVPDAAVAKAKRGWVIDWTLPGGGAEGERVVSRTQYVGGVVVVSSIIPENDPCLPGGRSWLNQVTPFIGHYSDRTFFDINGDGVFDEHDLIAYDDEDLPGNSAENPLGMTREIAVIGERGFTGIDDIGIDLDLAVGRISWHEIVAD